MSIKVYIHGTHRHYTDGLDIVEVEGDTVGDCLDYLVKQFPGIKEGLFEKDGKLKNIIEIYINEKSAYPNELARPVMGGDEVHLLVMLAGG